jgi:hypothetical protein
VKESRAAGKIALEITRIKIPGVLFQRMAMVIISVCLRNIPKTPLNKHQL